MKQAEVFRRLALALGLAALTGLGASAPAVGQGDAFDPQLVRLGEGIWKNQAPCRNCHGGLANGIGDVPQDPQGANLRETSLTPEEMREVIRCGLPTTEMPHFDRLAYTDARCYGLTAADLGPSVPPPGPPLSARQFDALVAFIFTSFVGRGDPTYEECIGFWGEGASTCARYPHAN